MMEIFRYYQKHNVIDTLVVIEVKEFISYIGNSISISIGQYPSFDEDPVIESPRTVTFKLIFYINMDEKSFECSKKYFFEHI